MNTTRNTTIRGPAALATTLLLGTLCLTACVQQGTQQETTPAGGGVVVQPPARDQVPVVFDCEPSMPEPVFQACLKNQRATFPHPPGPYQHHAQ